MGSSLDDLKSFPEDVRREAGYQLDKLQRDESPTSWKSMRSIGQGVREIRLRGDDGQYRVIYLANRADAVYVLHAFMKKTQKTRKSDIDLAKARLKEVPQ